MTLLLINIIGTCTASLPITSTQSKSYPKLDSNIIIDWNNLVFELGAKEKLSPPEYSRAYSLLHISIYETLLIATDEVTNLRVNESLTNAYYILSISEAASRVMNYLFPVDIHKIKNLKYSQTGQLQLDHYTSVVLNSSKLGSIVGEAVIEHAIKDNSDLMWSGTLPTVGKCTWNGTNPINPMAGFWKTYVLKSGSDIQPNRPETCGSDKDTEDLVQTYEIWRNRTPEQINAVHYWGDKPPPVIWNNILNEQIQKSNMSIFEVAFSSVYLNVGMYDGFVSCWYAKYNYWTARPFQRIANITTEIPTPNFPSYPSGHSVISVVSARILGELFPDKQVYFYDKATEAGLSRIWAGIHFKQDVTNGIDQGNKVAEKIILDMHMPSHSFIFS